MIEYQDIKLKSGLITAVKINFEHAPLIVFGCPECFVMCGYLDMNAANKLGDIAAKVTNVKTISSALDAPIVALSEEAKKFDVEIGMSARNFLNIVLKQIKH
jgi:uncharacterized protein YunC (DUF1805 family)